MLSNAVALIVVAVIVSVIAREFRHRDDPVTLCRYCGRLTAHPVELDHWHTDERTGESFIVYRWPFCSTACMKACVATQPKETP